MKPKASDLTDDEMHWLQKLQKRETAMITTKMSNRLIKLGVADAKLGGVGISRVGEELLMSMRRRR